MLTLASRHSTDVRADMVVIFVIEDEPNYQLARRHFHIFKTGVAKMRIKGED